MTSEDAIIEAVAKTVLRVAQDDEHTELRRLFWIASRCENCGASNASMSVCDSCEAEVVNRSGIPTRKMNDAVAVQWWNVRTPKYWTNFPDWEFPVLVVAGRVAVISGATGGLFDIGMAWDVARKVLEAAHFTCSTGAP